MRRSGAYLVVALLVLLAAATGSDASSPRNQAPTCPRVRPQVLVADAQAQVYQSRGAIIDRCEVPGSAKVSGHALGQRRSYLLGAAPWGTTVGVGGVSDETLAGPVVAYERYRETFVPHTASRLVVVRDLRTGRMLRSAAIASPAPSTATLVAIVVKSDGAAAWMVETGSYAGEYQVHAVDKRGSRVLAVGSDIEPHSLALAGSTLYWTQEGKPMSAALN